jgi:hypothetical protein
MRRTELRERRPWISFCQQDGTGRVSGKSMQVGASNCAAIPASSSAAARAAPMSSASSMTST